MINKNIHSICYGGDYNPEQWTEDVWVQDMELMKEAGVNFVSLAIFSWALLQPDENTFDFTFLDKIMDLLHSNGIYVDLATATASQPPWLSIAYDDVMPVSADGVKMTHGSRQTYCPNSRSWRNAASHLVRTLAARYKNHPALAMWHINNEYGCHTAECYCDNCAVSFRKWLQKRYKSVGIVNEKWGTRFWSQYYYKWDEIYPPRATMGKKNPSHVLDYKRFMSDSLLDCYSMEYEILRQITPELKITTNFLMGIDKLDYFKWAKEIDIISWDSYPDPAPSYNPALNAFDHDLMRGFGNGRPFILMEQAPAQVNWRDINVNKHPGLMRLYSYQAVGRGADGVMFFQWRQSLRGAEKFHSACITHSGDGNSRIFREVRQLGHELKKLNCITGSTRKADIAIVFDYENMWAFEYEDRQSKSVTYRDQILNWYKPLYEMNIPVDIVGTDSNLKGYKILLAPLLYMTKEGYAEKIKRFTADGGEYITTFSSSIVDEWDGVFPGGYPGPLKELLGITIEEFCPLTPDMKTTIALTDIDDTIPETSKARLWYDIIHIVDAEIFAVFSDALGKGYPAITYNYFGKGKAWYIGTETEPDFKKAFLSKICLRQNINSLFSLPEGVELNIREQNGKKYAFILNFSIKNASIDIMQNSYIDLLTGQKIHDRLIIESGNIRILEISS
ncbi:MAG: beta-galactosidase [Spirochaetaceae bacterium]|nr:beta-galactosidase [Spirochaetaceae bacterium]